MPAILRGYVRIIERIADVVGVVAMYLIFLMVGVLLLLVLFPALITDLPGILF